MNRRAATTIAAAVIALALPAGASAHGFGGTLGGIGAAPPAAAEGCPTAVDSEKFASADELLELNRTMARFGQRPTASRNHARFVDWLERRMRALPGVEVSELRYEFDRWLEGGASLTANGRGVRLANPVPYSKPTPSKGATGELVHVPHGTPIGDADVKGKIVVRDVVPGKVPRSAFLALSWFVWDPMATMAPETADDYERDYLGYLERVDDLRAAAEAGAAGLVLAHGFPHRQVRGQYAPYEGEKWKLPAVYVGVDEGERLKELASEQKTARIRLQADQRRATTRTLVATLPGMSEERIVVTSHTDGMNAIWDNGPIAMAALAREFAAQPQECRPRTLQFVFTTAHLALQTGAGANDYAKRLDSDYDKGTVAEVVVLEHLGAREYKAVPRENGPGREILPTGLSEPTGIFVGESPVLVGEMSRKIVEHDLQRTIVLRGADLPGARIPPHHSFGGEGTAYHPHLIPTVALVTGPWSLYNPSFGIEAIDKELLRKQTMVFADFVSATAPLAREALAGGYLAQRQARSGICSLAADGLGVAQCEQ